MPLRSNNFSFCSTLAVSALTFFAASLASAQTAITTYHVDNNRTGWNSHETVLTPANVGSSAFGLLQTVALNGQIDAQPLFVPGVTITAGHYQGVHDVVYVATEDNAIYAIDAEAGTVLLSPTFGTPGGLPAACNNAKTKVGITATPVIDLTSNTLYAVINELGTTGPAYWVHALDLGSLTDKVAPQMVVASHTLTDGTTFNFNAAYQRQRPALLLANGNIYAGFGSFCDSNVSVSRGVLLGWSTGTLAPLPANQTLDTQASSPNDWFLSSIWMSGYGPSTDDSGNILFVTGNSDPSGTTYDGITDIQESVVKVSSNLTTVLDVFTPYDQPTLDKADNDFGSGGVMVLPDQPGIYPHLAVAAGKEGNLFVMNEDDLGGYSTTKNNVLGTYPIGGCWCGPSYFVDPSDGLGRVVTSGGYMVEVLKVETSKKKTALAKVSKSPTIAGVNHLGFFTTISSNGTANPIIWAASHPTSATGAPLYLYAFNPESVSGGTMQQLLMIQAGKGNSNLVPVVANGEVFVATNGELEIFGITSAAKKGQSVSAGASSEVNKKP
jgi:hypothetical protein